MDHSTPNHAAVNNRLRATQFFAAFAIFGPNSTYRRRGVPDPFPLRVTIGTKYSPAMQIASEAEAAVYLERCVEHLRRSRPDLSIEEAHAIERQNLGYFAGYCGEETRARVERLFRCAHPIFGAIAENGPPTPEQALEAGMRMAGAHN
jgi:hypothetical protein